MHADPFGTSTDPTAIPSSESENWRQARRARAPASSPDLQYEQDSWFGLEAALLLGSARPPFRQRPRVEFDAPAWRRPVLVRPGEEVSTVRQLDRAVLAGEDHPWAPAALESPSGRSTEKAQCAPEPVVRRERSTSPLSCGQGTGPRQTGYGPPVADVEHPARSGGQPEDATPLLTSRELAERLNVSTRTVLAWTQKKKIPHLRLPDGRPRYKWKDVVACLASDDSDGGARGG